MKGNDKLVRAYDSGTDLFSGARDLNFVLSLYVHPVVVYSKTCVKRTLSKRPTVAKCRSKVLQNARGAFCKTFDLN